jgi:uncharacterized iron-regulated membrane protein
MLRRLHRYIGLALALPLILQALTGMVLAADPFVAFLLSVPSANGPLTEPDDLRNVDVAAILAVAHGAVPTEQEARRWRVLPDGIVAIDFGNPGQQQTVAQVGVDVAFMRPIWVRQNPDRFYRWVHSVHETLLLGPTGRSIVGSIGIGLFLLGLIGIPLWWPPRARWKTGFIVTRTASGWRLQRELHGAAGIWVAGLLLVQSASGIALAFPQTARAVVGLPAQAPRFGRPAANVRFDPVRSIVAGIASSEAALPKAVLQDLRLPAVPGRPMIAVLLPPGYWVGAPVTVVWMDPVTAEVSSIQDPQIGAPGASVLAWLRAAHEGGAAGPVGRLLVCLFALALVLLPVTGFAMWMLRWRMRHRGMAMTRAGAVRQ